MSIETDCQCSDKSAGFWLTLNQTRQKANSVIPIAADTHTPHKPHRDTVPPAGQHWNTQYAQTIFFPIWGSTVSW